MRKSILGSLLVSLLFLVSASMSVNAQPINPLLYTNCGGYGEPNCAQLQTQYMIDYNNWMIKQNPYYDQYGQNSTNDDYDSGHGNYDSDTNDSNYDPCEGYDGYCNGNI